MEKINQTNIVFFSDNTSPTISQVGGKGYSLNKLANNGIYIPFGFILTVKFFEDFKTKIKESEEWKAYINGKQQKNKNFN